ncbi:MAG: hypothetical protein KF760_18135 [Candidatus Eremiobacteraeota bacterium]|nr:hypothetical protein [Candidatus Eremiobacteraeota bacterium]MCW5866715.1 hypothetical protein [Candidatus Eremiobacteraeota bacterium]
MVTISLREGRLASLESRWRGCQALGSSQDPHDSVSLLGIRDQRIRLLDCDDKSNLQMRLEQTPKETVMVLRNPGEKDSPAIAIGLDCHIPCDDSWLSFEKLGSGITQLTVTPRPGGASLEVVDNNTVEYQLSTQGVAEPSIASPAMIEVPDDWKLAVREALGQ